MMMLVAILTCFLIPPRGPATTGGNKVGLPCLKSLSIIPLPGKTNRFDYQSIDHRRSLLFISHLGDNAVTVFDLKSRRVIKNISGIPSPHGILAVSALGRVFVSATGVNRIYTIDERSLKVIGKTWGGYFPDGIGYAPGPGRIFVSDEFGKTVTVIDARSLKPIGRVDIGGRVGNTHFDPSTGDIVTADESADELVMIDPSNLRITGRIALPGCGGAHGFIIGVKPYFAYVTGEDNASLVVVDMERRKVIQRSAVGADPDVLAMDRGLGLLYVASESGVVSVYRTAVKGLTQFCRGRLWPHAHSVCVEQKTHEVFFPIQNFKGSPALLIFSPLH